MKAKVLAIIPARGGSKRVPNKNLRHVGGISLVGRAVISAMQSELITHIAVSSDSTEIKTEALRWIHHYRHKPKQCFVLSRDPRLAEDHTPLDEVLLSATKQINNKISPFKIDKVVTLQPTSPFRPPGLIDKCIRAQECPINSVLTVHQAGHFFWVEDNSHPTVKKRLRQVNATGRPNSQDLETHDHYWIENGCVYVTDAYALLTQRTRVAFHSIGIPIDMPHVMDIDTDEDFKLAEIFHKSYNPDGGSNVRTEEQET